MRKSASHSKPLSVISGPPIATSDQISKITRRKKNTYSPSNLYLKGKFYYFRASIPKKFRIGIGQSEVRIGLQTPYIGEARRIATKLRVRMDEILDENVPVSPDHLRKELLARFIKVLEQDDKIHISHREIKDRLQEYLRKQLDLHLRGTRENGRVVQSKTATQNNGKRPPRTL